MRVYWDAVCRGSQNCRLEVKQGWSSNQTASESASSEYSYELADSLTQTASVGASGEFAGVTFEGSFENVPQTDTNYSTQLKQASRIVRSRKQGAEATCGSLVDMSDGKIQGVFQWVTETKFKGDLVTIRSCTIACTPDGQEPRFTPDSAEFVNSCNPA